jgi:enoyl-CoA hydratase
MAAYIARRRTNGIEVVMLQRPPVNAMDLALLEELKELFAALAEDSSARAVVLTGQGPTFCAGLDVKLVPQYGKAEQLRLLEVLNRTILAVYGCSLPVVGAINGHAIAGGLVLALCCDWRIVAAADNQASLVEPQMSLAEVKVAIPYPVAAMEVVRSELSEQIARRLVLSGENLGLSEALSCGVFDESAPRETLMETALAKAARYAELPRAAFATIKRQLKEPTLSAIASALHEGREPLREHWISEETLAATKRPR